MGRQALTLLFAAALFGFALFPVGCDNDFSPKTEFKSQIAVFCILDPAQEYQSVLLARSYDAELGITLRPLTTKEVQEATVRIIGGGKTYDFRDTVVTLDGGGTRTAWINRELMPRHETDYRLQVDVPGETQLRGAVTMPSRIYVRVERIRVDTGKGNVRVHPGVTGFAVPPDAFYFRLWSETWKRLPGGDTLKSRLEIPLYGVADGGWVYPAPARTAETIYQPGVISQIVKSNEQPGDSVIARRLVAHGYAMDRQFYSYYKIARGFDDPLSVRLDSPDLSFIEGGLGVFGGMVSGTVLAVFFVPVFFVFVLEWQRRIAGPRGSARRPPP
ncbi:MAG: DUF4249 family protein, partial [Bacteroidota bacterium]|nr:DUF4249 family protein [Bacteroidota bacterium]